VIKSHKIRKVGGKQEEEKLEMLDRSLS